MKILKIVVLLLSFTILSSCGDEEDSETAELTVKSSNVGFMVPISIERITPCTDGVTENIQKSYVSLSRLQIEWSDINYDLEIARIRLSVENPNLGPGEVSKDLLDLDILQQTEGSGDPVLVTNGQVEAPQEANTPKVVSLRAGCPATFQGFQLVNEDTTFEARGIVEIYGLKRVNAKGVENGEGDLGDERIVRSTTQVNVIYE